MGRIRRTKKRIFSMFAEEKTNDSPVDVNSSSSLPPPPYSQMKENSFAAVDDDLAISDSTHTYFSVSAS
jgi:hypothetical protein